MGGKSYQWIFAEISLLERLMTSCTAYARGRRGNYNSDLLTKLVNNYRSHKAIIEIPKQLFYDNELNECAGDFRWDLWSFTLLYDEISISRKRGGWLSLSSTKRRFHVYLPASEHASREGSFWRPNRIAWSWFAHDFINHCLKIVYKIMRLSYQARFLFQWWNPKLDMTMDMSWLC